jgi:two-component system, cell cycle response regulator
MTGRIYVVDDVEQNVKLLEAKLSAEYYTVFSAYSGIECLRQVKTVQPDVILLDVMMPEMDGFETCRRLKADPETAHIPVVMVTALSEQKNRVTGLEAGATDFITKPINEMHLFARVKSLVRLKMMLDELRLRDKTSSALGLASQSINYNEQPHGQILVVDDDLMQSNKIRETLTQQGNQVTILDTVTKAAEAAAAGQFDMVIISTMLDDVDGLRLAMQILAIEKNRQLPILMLVDEEERQTLIKGLEIGIDDYILCPLDPNELIARVNTQIRRKQFQDMLKQNYQESLSAAIMDSLTKLYNRRYLDVHLEHIVTESLQLNKPLSIMTIDIDHFKAVNDRPGWGHHIGDEVLAEVANRIKQSTRGTDLATRPGGEEFVVIMPNTPLQTALMVADRLRQNMAAKPIAVSAEPKQAAITVSIGVSSLLGKTDTVASLLQRSDEALYHAKRAGRNRVITMQPIQM